MKSNIDLTENEMFSRQEISDLFSALMHEYIYGKIPWDFGKLTEVESDYALKGSIPFEPIPLGSKAERDNKQSCKRALLGEYCDRCGKSLATIPWEMNKIRLCRKCMSEMEYEYGNKKIYLWGQVEGMKPNNEIISLTW